MKLHFTKMQGADNDLVMIDATRAPRGAKPLSKALSVDQAVALAEHRDAGDDSAHAEALADTARRNR